MTKIVTVFNQKGGASKTTSSINISGAAARRGLKVLYVDMDPQGTGMIWVSQADENNPFPAKAVNLSHLKGKLGPELKKYLGEMDLIIIDCPPAMESDAPAAALLISDLAIIPVQMSMLDVWSTAQAKLLIERSMTFNPDLKPRFLATMTEDNDNPKSKDRRTAVEKSCASIVEEDDSIPVMTTRMRRRNAYRESPAYGQSVHVLSRQKAAIAEVESILDEILELLDIKVQKPITKKKKSAEVA